MLLFIALNPESPSKPPSPPADAEHRVRAGVRHERAPGRPGRARDDDGGQANADPGVAGLAPRRPGSVPAEAPGAP